MAFRSTAQKISAQVTGCVANLEITDDGEPVIVINSILPANDLIEVHISGNNADILFDGRRIGTAAQLTNTVRNWLVLAEEVAVRAANYDPQSAESTYVPVYPSRTTG